MYDSEIHNYISECTSTGDNFGDNPKQLINEFKDKMHNHIVSSKRNNAKGLDDFPQRDVITGVTQFIDNIYQMKKLVYVLQKEYMYHFRLYGGRNILDTYKKLRPGNHLIISAPFPYYADFHPDMDKILDHCAENHVGVHIDACWWTCSKDLDFNFSHPAIKSIGFSLSKGLGLGANRIGIRYTKNLFNEETKALTSFYEKDSINLANDYDMVNQSPVWLGTKFIDKFGTDFWWNKYEDTYNKMCKELDLTPSKAIHIAYDDKRMCGVRPILRKIYGR